MLTKKKESYKEIERKKDTQTDPIGNELTSLLTRTNKYKER